MHPKLEFLFSRRSIRKYTPELVTEAEIQALLEAGMSAPSARNSQPWRLVVVTQRETMQALGAAHVHGKMTAEAALAIVVCADKTTSPYFWPQDCAAATQNILIAAAALGLGAVWLGVYPHADREAALRPVLGIPDEIGIQSMIAIGRPAESKAPRTQFDTAKVHREKW